jgi:hypothetical protein
LLVRSPHLTRHCWNSSAGFSKPSQRQRNSTHLTLKILRIWRTTRLRRHGFVTSLPPFEPPRRRSC